LPVPHDNIQDDRYSTGLVSGNNFCIWISVYHLHPKSTNPDEDKELLFRTSKSYYSLSTVLVYLDCSPWYNLPDGETVGLTQQMLYCLEYMEHLSGCRPNKILIQISQFYFFPNFLCWNRV
jgi:hypothetical protein